jgi:hypothetical protein
MKPSLNDLTPEQAEALKAFASSNGRTWKMKLSDMWANGQDANQTNGGLLRQIRNQQGPSWLYKLKGL